MAKKKAARKKARGIVHLPVKTVKAREASRVVGGNKVKTSKELNYHTITLEN